MLNAELEPGLYIVATPIGNLGDVSARAVDVLSRAAAIAVEDSRVTGKLLHHLGLKRPMLRYNDHSDDAARDAIVARLGHEAIALVSDAGTPLISDPGYKLVRAARAAGHAVRTIPGPNAAIAALTLAGLPTDRFLFAGFLPSKSGQRRTALAELGAVRATLVLYESGPRLAAMLADALDVLGHREAAVARELTKLHEECVTAPLAELVDRYREREPKGELVVVIGPPPEVRAVDPDATDELLADALARLSVGQAASEVAKATGQDRRTLYQRALALRG